MLKIKNKVTLSTKEDISMQHLVQRIIELFRMEGFSVESSDGKSTRFVHSKKPRVSFEIYQYEEKVRILNRGNAMFANEVTSNESILEFIRSSYQSVIDENVRYDILFQDTVFGWTCILKNQDKDETLKVKITNENLQTRLSQFNSLEFMTESSWEKLEIEELGAFDPESIEIDEYTTFEKMFQEYLYEVLGPILIKKLNLE
ncbi:MAG: hypothetical protein ACRCXZ_01485 [Patescibacteria group bacterium]